MTKTFTQADVIRFIYDDLSSHERDEIKQAIICDARLQYLYNELTGLKKQLDQCMKKPSDKVLENIVNYSKSLNLCSNN